MIDQFDGLEITTQISKKMFENLSELNIEPWIRGQELFLLSPYPRLDSYSNLNPKLRFACFKATCFGRFTASFENVKNQI